MIFPADQARIIAAAVLRLPEIGERHASRANALLRDAEAATAALAQAETALRKLWQAIGDTGLWTPEEMDRALAQPIDRGPVDGLDFAKRCGKAFPLGPRAAAVRFFPPDGDGFVRLEEIATGRVLARQPSHREAEDVAREFLESEAAERDEDVAGTLAQLTAAMDGNPYNQGPEEETAAPPPEPTAPAVGDVGKRLRKFSAAGPCLTHVAGAGEIIAETAKSWRVRGRDGREHHVRKSSHGYHADPCRSCTDHPSTSYPHGYMD